MYTLMHDRWYYNDLERGRIVFRPLPTATFVMQGVHALSPAYTYYKVRVRGLMRNGVGHHLRHKFHRVQMCTMATQPFTAYAATAFIRATGLTIVRLEPDCTIIAQTVNGWPIVNAE